MRPEDIITFLAIVDQKGILKAAEHLFVSQSTVSNRLLSLEQTLQTKLIDRSPGQKELSLTKRGEDFLPYAREFAFLNNTIIEWSARTPRDRLRIATIDSITTPLFKEFYRKLATETSLFLEISHHWTDRIFSLLENHQADLGLVPRLFNSKQVITRPIFQEEMVAVSFSSLPNPVHPHHLPPANEIYFDWGTSFVTWHHRWFDPIHYPKMIVDITEPLFEALRIPDTWSIIPLGVALASKKRFPVYISCLMENPPPRIVYLATRPEIPLRKQKSMELFEERLKRFIRDHHFLQLME